MQVWRCKLNNEQTKGLQIISTYRWNNYLGHVSDSLIKQNKNSTYLANNKIKYYLRYLCFALLTYINIHL